MIKTSFTCIIPFYNESERFLDVIQKVLEVKSITQVILVNDGSTNATPTLIKERLSNIELINLSRNQGKSTAVKKGLEKAKNENILMLDADYKNVTAQEIELILNKYLNSGLDMLLMQVKGGNNWLDRLLRKEILFTGFRILRKYDLEKVFASSPKGYQLEVAINNYMVESNKAIAWSPCNIMNIHKSKKWGIINGLVKSIRMELSIMAYLRPIRFLRQVLFFGTTKLI